MVCVVLPFSSTREKREKRSLSNVARSPRAAVIVVIGHWFSVTGHVSFLFAFRLLLAILVTTIASLER